MRAEWLRNLTPKWDWQWVDTDLPMIESARVWRSLAFRKQSGPAVDRINSEVLRNLKPAQSDLIWVDKAVFLRPATLQKVRSAARRLVHFTPDTAFGANTSRHFEANIGLYDVLVTTKSFELGKYADRVPADRMCLTTQGFDPLVHYPRGSSEVRRREVAFVGLAEPDREQCVATMLEHNVHIRLAGRGWTRFVAKWEGHACLHFEGEDSFGDAYAGLLSKAWIGLGLLSKRFSELHTTRTFEIPACGAILATPRTSETTRFFADSEAIFFDDYAELAKKIAQMFSQSSAQSLEKISEAGRKRVTADGRDYPRILSRVLEDPRLS